MRNAFGAYVHAISFAPYTLFFSFSYVKWLYDLFCICDQYPPLFFFFLLLFNMGGMKWKNYVSGSFFIMVTEDAYTLFLRIDSL